MLSWGLFVVDFAVTRRKGVGVAFASTEGRRDKLTGETSGLQFQFTATATSCYGISRLRDQLDTTGHLQCCAQQR